ncbi:RNA 2',3'-cyclic phosphodiesterase [Pseudalkalibacillus sp. R45]|uniref:RNA 2',3'-cyclic phosphodiesterase n=1 Tax=Pseudalkalibacillus sp. R45 TaxID=3457433 RepID=UPI003FCE27DC
MARHTFFAVPIPHEIQKEIHSYAQELKPLLPLKKWTSLGDYHITLQFLGASPDKELEQLIHEINKINSHTFTLTLKSSGYFGNPKTPRVFWLGIGRFESLLKLQEQTKQACISAGFDVDSRPYRPHITIGKRWGGDSQGISYENLPEPKELISRSWEVEEIILYEIHPGKEPMYVPYHRFQIGETFKG